MGESIKLVIIVLSNSPVFMNQLQVTRNGVAIDSAALKFFELAIENDAEKLSQSFDVYDVCRGDGGDV